MTPLPGIATPTDQRTARELLDQDGLVRLPSVIAPHAVDAMREHLLRRVADFPFVEVAGALRPARGTELGMWEVGRDDALASLPDSVAKAVARAFGPGVWTQAADEDAGLFMPNLPFPAESWRIAHDAWHVDEAVPAGEGPSGVLLAFATLDALEPGGGATVAVAGSPRRLLALADRLGELVTTDVALKALAEEEPWFADLLRGGKALREGCVSQGIELRVEEMTGGAGDVVLMDPRCLHSTSANVSTRPRLTMRMTFLRAPPGRSR